MQITLGVTGGVAAYKAAELVRRLQQEGFSVEVVMTRAACAFVRPLTFAALSGKKVITAIPDNRNCRLLQQRFLMLRIAHGLCSREGWADVAVSR